MSLPAYRITTEDLQGGDKKAIAAVEPLLDALNCSLTPAIDAVNALPVQLTRTGKVTTSELGAAYLDVATGGTPAFVWVNIFPAASADVLDSVWSMSWTMAGATTTRLLLVGLAVSTTYTVVVRWE